MDVFGAKVLRIFKVLFQKHLKAEVWNGSSNILRKNKKHGNRRAFCVALSVGASAPNPDQRTFREKSLGTSKAFAKINVCVLSEVLCFTFLRKKGKKTERRKSPF